MNVIPADRRKLTDFEFHFSEQPDLSEELRMLREQVRRFVEKEVVPHGEQWERDGVAPLRRHQSEARPLCIHPHITSGDVGRRRGRRKRDASRRERQTSPGGVVRVDHREPGIGQALELARQGDTILLAGKGHETYQVVGTTKEPFDEREVVRSLGAN